MFFFSPNSSLLNLFFLGTFYGTIASVITWIAVPELTQPGYSKACACSYCGCWQMPTKWPGKQHLLHQYDTQIVTGDGT
jgi:hypothetical protein